jgi:hypothetical protein
MENLKVYRGKSKLTCIGEAFTANVVQIFAAARRQAIQTATLVQYLTASGGADERG